VQQLGCEFLEPSSLFNLLAIERDLFGGGNPPRNSFSAFLERVERIGPPPVRTTIGPHGFDHLLRETASPNLLQMCHFLKDLLSLLLNMLD
jgi:hypothetical protein